MLRLFIARALLLVVWMAGVRGSSRLCRFPGLMVLLVSCPKVEDPGVWPEGLLDVYIAMIPRTDGDATPLGQRPLSVLPIAYRIWASARMVQLEAWLQSWVPDSVFSAGGGRSSVEAWQTTALDTERFLLVLLNLMSVCFWLNVIKSSDTGWSGCR